MCWEPRENNRSELWFHVCRYLVLHRAGCAHRDFWPVSGDRSRCCRRRGSRCGALFPFSVLFSARFLWFLEARCPAALSARAVLPGTGSTTPCCRWQRGHGPSASASRAGAADPVSRRSCWAPLEQIGLMGEKQPSATAHQAPSWDAEPTASPSPRTARNCNHTPKGQTGWNILTVAVTWSHPRDPYMSGEAAELDSRGRV